MAGPIRALALELDRENVEEGQHLPSQQKNRKQNQKQKHYQLTAKDAKDAEEREVLAIVASELLSLHVGRRGFFIGKVTSIAYEPSKVGHLYGRCHRLVAC